MAPAASSPKPATVVTERRAGLPSVSVPVLSTTSVSTVHSCSMASATFGFAVPPVSGAISFSVSKTVFTGAAPGAYRMGGR